MVKCALDAGKRKSKMITCPLCKCRTTKSHVSVLDCKNALEEEFKQLSERMAENQFTLKNIRELIKNHKPVNVVES